MNPKMKEMRSTLVPALQGYTQDPLSQFHTLDRFLVLQLVNYSLHTTPQVHIDQVKSIYQMLLNTMNASPLAHQCSFFHPGKASAQDSSDRVFRVKHRFLALEYCICMRVKERSKIATGERCVLLSRVAKQESIAGCSNRPSRSPSYSS